MNLQESIRRILREETKVSLATRRRSQQIKKLLDIVLYNSLPCRYRNTEDFILSVINEVKDIFYAIEFKELEVEEVKNFIKEYLIDDIKRYYIDSQEDC